MMKKQKSIETEENFELFEEIYIRTYLELGEHIRYLTENEKEVKEILVSTYIDFYSHIGESSDYEDILDWLIKKSDLIAETEIGVDSNKIEEVTFIEEKIEEIKEKEKKNSIRKTKFDETSVFLEIKDRVKSIDNSDLKEDVILPITIVKILVSCAFLIATVTIIIFGAEKISHQIQLIKKPFFKSFSVDKDKEGNQNNFVKISGKQVCLSNIGQVLYTLPLSEEEKNFQNSEIQRNENWVYYLPCPERTNTLLSDVSPSLSHILYRVDEARGIIQIVAKEVEDYCLWNDKICMARLGSIQTIDTEGEFEDMVPGTFIYEKEGRYYLKDLLGRSLSKNEDGNIEYEDRVFQMQSDCILSVEPAKRVKDGISYELRNIDEDHMGIYKQSNGMEELFLEEERVIDSFCLVDNWLYYSVFVRKGESSANYSKIFRKSLTSEEDSKRVSEEFPGRIYQMYYEEKNRHIYANYLPKNWKNNYGVVAVIALNGQMSYLDDEELRLRRETTGNDALEFIMVQDNLVYCYWKDYQWDEETKKATEILWQDTLCIPNGDRIFID